MATIRDSSKASLALRDDADVLASALPPLMVEAERVANTVSQGVHGRRKVGIGETFWEYRHHRPQDPLTAIDWRQSAKTDHLYVRENEWEAAESVWLWRDASPSMDYQSDLATCNKKQRSSVLLLAVASLLVGGGERIARLGSTEPPRAGRPALRRIALRLTEENTTTESIPPALPLPRFAQMVWVSDFLTPVESLEEIIYSYAAQGVQGHLLQVLDPAEEDLPFTGRTRFEGMEGEDALTFGKAEGLREDYQKNLNEHRNALHTITQRLGWTFTCHRTDHAPQTALLALYMALAGETLTDVGHNEFVS